MRSSSPAMSTRQEGTVTRSVSPSRAGENPSAARISTQRAAGMSIPRNAARRARRSVSVRRACGLARRSRTSIVPRHSVPPHASRMRRAARSSPSRVASGSVPRSKRCEASVCMPRERDVLRTARGSKCAPSRRTRVVFSEIAVASPPMTPARATGFSASAITRCWGVSARATPSSVTSVSPARARRTMIVGKPSTPFASVSRSNAWSGWPMSQRTWFVASTGAEIVPAPIARSRAATAPPVAPTRIPSRTRAEYRAQSSGSST